MEQALSAIAVAIFISSATFLVTKVILEPALTLRRTIGEIDAALTFWGERWANPGLNVEQDAAAKAALRTLAARLRAETNAVPFYRAARLFRIVPPYAACRTAASDLIGVSNFAGREPINTSKDVDKIRIGLGLPHR